MKEVTLEEYDQMDYPSKAAYLKEIAKDYGYVRYYPQHYQWLGKSYRELPESEGGYRMATTAYCTLGDISSDTLDLCKVYGETLEHYVGSWVTGYGFFDVKFPKETTRKLTKEEAAYWNKRSVQISSQRPVPIRIPKSDVAENNRFKT